MDQQQNDQRPKTPQPQYQAQPLYPQVQQQQQSSVVIISQPTAAAPAYQPQNIKEWSTGICGCCEDCGVCWLAFLCPPIHWCCLASKMDECCVGPFFCQHFFQIPMRTKLRSMHGIRGSIIEDLCCIVWCPCCAATQMHRELKNSGHIS